MQRSIGPREQIYRIRGYFSPWYCICTNAMFISKGSQGNDEPKNVILVSVQKAHFAARTYKQIGFMQHRVGPTVQICGNSGLPFVMVPCLHQCNVYIKRKLRERRAQKCNPCFGAKSPLRSTGLQTTWFHASGYRADSTNLPQFLATFCHGTVFSPMQCLYQKETKRMQSPKM